MIAEKIKALREQRGLTQSELAKQVGITRAGVNAWEMGISVPCTQYIITLAHIFNVSTDYLLGVVSSSTVSVSGLTEEDTQIVCALVDYLRKKNRS